MQNKAEIIASHLFFKFLNEKFNFIGEPLTEKQIEYYEKAVSLNKIKHLVYMFTENKSAFVGIKQEIEDRMTEIAMEFFENERQLAP